MINLHESMGPGWDRTRDPWICSKTRICSQTRYRLRYTARIYECRYLLVFRFRHLSHMLMHLAAYRHVYLVAYNSMHAIACLSSGTRSLRSILFCLSRRNMHNLSLCALRHNSGPDVCSSSECPAETVHLPRLI